MLLYAPVRGELVHDVHAAVISLFETQPGAKEIQVEAVKFLRYGEDRGDYDQVVAALNTH